jgi:hypothetical protein
MEWNANGLLQHQHELQVILSTENIDICLISETHFTKESFIRFKNYITYHTVHPANTARGGSAIILRNNIKHYEEEKYATHEIQATIVTIETSKQRLTVSAIYCPPRYNIHANEYKELFGIMNNRFIIGGDFNAKHTHWGSRLITSKGRELYKATSDFGCEVLSTGKPTYWPTDPKRTPDLIDFFVVKNISPNYIKIEEGFDLNSDHSPILLTTSDKIITKDQNPVLTNKHTDWEYFNYLLESSTDLTVPLKTVDQLEEELIAFTTAIQEAAWNSTPVNKTKLKGLNYPKEIKNLIAEKRKLRRRWHQTRNPHDKTLLNRISQQLSKEINNIKQSSLNKFLTDLTPDSSTEYSLWKATKHFKRPISQAPPIKTMDGKWARNNTEKANIFAQHLEQRFLPNPGPDILPLLTSNDYLDKIPLVTPKEVSEEIMNNLNPKKAPGFDLITGEILKNLKRKASVKLTMIINACIRLKHVPNIWKTAEVIMILKPGKNPSEVDSYRPISLLPVMSKLFEKLMLKRLQPIIKEKQLVPTHQFGFRKNHSTIDQVHRITDIIEKTLENKGVCSAVFLDVAQAFDRVWHKGLLHKLRSILPDHYYQLLKSYLTNRHFRVKHEDAYSELKSIKAGVPQGSVLGPVLYLLYINDMPTTSNSITATFADDTAVLAVGETVETSTKKLQSAVNKVATWTTKWRIELNESKSVHIDFTNKRITQQSIFINGAQVPYTNTAKYLGMNLDAKLRWKEHIKKKRDELNIKFRKMYWLLGRNSELSIHNKLLLYKQVLRPVWSYGIQLWGCASNSNIQVIQRYQNKVLKCIVNAPWYVRNSDLHRDLGIETVADITTKLANSHEMRLQNHINIEASRLLNVHNITRRLKRKKPFELVKREMLRVSVEVT